MGADYESLPKPLQDYFPNYPFDKVDGTMRKDTPRDRPADGIKITPEMVEAGVIALEAAASAFSSELTIREVYVAMSRASQKAST